MKVSLLLLGISLLSPAFARQPNHDLTFQNSKSMHSSPEQCDSKHESKWAKLLRRPPKTKPASRPNGKTSVYDRLGLLNHHKPKSCFDELWYCTDFMQCLDCNGICKVEKGEEVGVCVDRPPSCSDEEQFCTDFTHCLDCNGICQVKDGEEVGVCVDKPDEEEPEEPKPDDPKSKHPEPEPHHESCKGRVPVVCEDDRRCGFCNGYCDIPADDTVGLCVDKPKNKVHKFRASNPEIEIKIEIGV
ncbi:hypothetical protein ABW19_dt0201122 [Dactylella cylindrospora]|nr:hypothetical protein ABW19_dt0201122 [Dactylella cylindrospora]